MCHPVISPLYYRNTGAAGEYLLRSEEHFPRLEATISFYFKYLHQQCREGRYEGMLDWGDVPLIPHGQRDHTGASHPESSPFRGYTGWNNNDFGLARTAAIPVRPVILWMRSTTWHVIDVDTVHICPAIRRWSGWAARQQHWGAVSTTAIIDSAMYCSAVNSVP